MRFILVCLVTLISSTANAQDSWFSIGKWFGSSSESPVAGITLDQYNRSIGVCRAYIPEFKSDKGLASDSPWPETWCKCMVQRAYEHFPPALRESIALLVPNGSRTDIEFFKQYFATEEFKARSEKSEALRSLKINPIEISPILRQCRSGIDVGNPDPAKNIFDSTSQSGDVTSRTLDGPPTVSDIAAVLDQQRFYGPTISVTNLSCSEIGKNQYACSFSSVRDYMGKVTQNPNDGVKVMRYGTTFKELP